MKKSPLLLLLGLLALVAQPALAQSPDIQAAIDAALVNKYANTITPADMRRHLSIIASDEYEGRETGEKGQKMAAEYLKKHYQSLGLKGAATGETDVYFQPVPLMRSAIGNFTISDRKNTLVGFEDFAPYGAFVMPSTEAEVVFAGFAIEDEKYNDFENLDIKGKIVVFMDGEPMNEDGTFLLSGSEEKYTMAGVRQKRQLLAEKGALMAVRVFPTEEDYNSFFSLYGDYLQRPSLGLVKEEQQSNSTFGYVMTTPQKAALMLGTSYKKLKKHVDKAAKKGISAAGKFGNTVTLTAEMDQKEIMSENVAAILEGTDLKDELLVISSHYDHVGIIDGEIHNGADDDGSGTTGVLELAEAWAMAAKDGHRPRRSILFLNVTGEEKGLLGSEYYSDNPLYPLEGTVTNLNIDMIGRIDDAHADDPNYVYIIGSDMLSSDLHNLSEALAASYYPEFKMDYTYNDRDDPNRFYYRSDHYNFAKHGIPVIFYFNGTHEDYHKPTDDVDKIAFDQMANRAKMVFVTSWEIANRDKRPFVDKAN